MRYLVDYMWQIYGIGYILHYAWLYYLIYEKKIIDLHQHPDWVILISIGVMSIMSVFGLSIMIFFETKEFIKAVYLDLKLHHLKKELFKKQNIVKEKDKFAVVSRQIITKGLISSDLFIDESSKEPLVKYIQEVFQVQFTTPEETINNLNELQFFTFMLYIETLVDKGFLKINPEDHTFKANIN